MLGDVDVEVEVDEGVDDGAVLLGAGSASPPAGAPTA